MATIRRTRKAIPCWKVCELAFLLIPGGLVLLLGIGEIVGGSIGGMQHFVQALPLVALAILAWCHPRPGGVLLVCIGMVLAVLYPFAFGARFPAGAILFNDVLLFSPAIAAGRCFLAAARS